MSILTILTERHKQALEAFNLHCDATIGGLYETNCPKDKIDIDGITALLERIVILGHPVYGHSHKLADMAFDLCRTGIHQVNVAELTCYLEEYNLLHLEGYAAFRMSDYRNKLDVMMYCLIKKLKLADSLS